MTNAEMVTILKAMKRIVTDAAHADRVAAYGYTAGETAQRMVDLAIKVMFTKAQVDAIKKMQKFHWKLEGAYSQPVDGKPALLLVMRAGSQAAGIKPDGTVIRAKVGRTSFDVPQAWWL